MPDTKHLRKRFNTYFLHVKVPLDLREKVGKTFESKSLHTGDLRQARARRDVELGRIREAWERLREDHPVGSLKWLQASADDLKAQLQVGSMDREEADTLVSEMLELHLAKYRKSTAGEPDVPDEVVAKIRSALRAVDRPHDVTLKEALEAYLKDNSHLRPLTLSEKRRWLEEFTAWYGTAELIRDVDRAAAGRYVRDVIQTKPLAAKTKKHAIGDLSTWFNWLDTAGLVEGNPFYRLSSLVKESSRGRTKKERPWKTAELVKLFTALPATDRKWQIAALALYTGMRREEIAQIELTEIRSNLIHIPEGKTESAVRDVPVHPIIRPLVKYLRKDTDDEYLLGGLKRVDVNSKRGHSIGNRFTEYKNNVLKLREVRFHDLRATFITALQQADVAPLNIQQIVGHKSGSVTFDTYSAGVKPARLLQDVARATHGRRVDRLVAKKIAEL